MDNNDKQRIYLTCGTVFLTLIALVVIVLISTSGADSEIIAAAIALTISVLILVFNATLLFAAKNSGPRLLLTGRILLWLSCIIFVAAWVLCIVSIAS